MRRKVLLILGVSFIVGLVSQTGLAAESQPLPLMVPAKQATQGLEKSIMRLKKQAGVPVLYPRQVPKSENLKNYYASFGISDRKNGVSYRLYFDSTEKCRGAHYCNIGEVSAHIGGNPQMYHDMGNQEITVPVKLAHGIKGYYTPAHAMGDFWPSMIVWRCQHVLYTLTWQLKPADEKDIIMQMANSAIGNEQICIEQKGDKRK